MIAYNILTNKRQQENFMSVKWRFQRIESEIFSVVGPLGEKLNFFIPLGFSLVSEL